MRDAPESDPPKSAAHGRSRASALPAGTLPRGLSRPQAAEYVGVGSTKFDELVGDGRMPRPKRIDGRKI